MAPHPSLVRSDGATVWWATGSDIMHAGPEGQLIESASTGPVSQLVLLDKDIVYLVAGLLQSRPKSGFNIGAVADAGTGWSGIWGATGATSLVATRSDGGAQVLTPPDTLVKVGFAGGTVISAAVANGSVVAVLGPPTSNAGFSPALPDAGAALKALFPVSVAYDGSTVFVSDGTGTVTALNIGDLSTLTLAKDEENPVDLTLSGTYLYYRTKAGVKRVPKTGGCVQVVSEACTSFDVAGGHLYFTNGSGVYVVSLPL